MPDSRTDDPTEVAYTTVGPDARSYRRYAQVILEGSSILVYDRDNENAWIESTMGLSLAQQA